jgi:hypothetical protein
MASSLITGASNGIGLALAHEFAAQGHDLILVARNNERLQTEVQKLHTQHGREVIGFAADLSEPGAAAELFRKITDQGHAVSHLINNAGFASYGPFHQISITEQLNMIDLNIRSLTELSHRFIPMLLQHPESRLVNVASTAAFFPGPLMAVYYATKAYVLSFSEALAEEYRTTSLAVCALCPGPTKTGFQDRAQMTKSRLMNGQFMTSEEVARIAYSGIIHGETVIIPGHTNRLMSNLPRFLPRNMITRIVAGAQEPNY